MKRKRHEHVPTGVPGFDRLIKGGIPKNHLYLLNGESGAGKTTFCMQFLMQGAENGEKSLYIGTSETEKDIMDMASSHDWDISGIDIHYHSGSLDVDEGPKQTMLHPAEVQLPRTMERLISLIDEISPDRLVIDSLTEIRLLAREKSWFRDQLKILQHNLAEKECTVFLTDLPREDQRVLRSIVHGTIRLEQISPVYGPDHRRLKISKMRGIPFSSGYHDMDIIKGGIKLFPRLVAAEHHTEFKYEIISSGLEKLDDLLGGGIDRGTSILIAGPTGTGKSTLAAQYVVEAARRGEKSAMFIFDERVQTLYQRSAGVGLELESYVNEGLITVRQIDPAELSPGEFSYIVRERVNKGARFVVIDSLNGYSYAMPEVRFLSVHLHELLSYLNQKGITSLQVMTQHTLQDWKNNVFEVSYIADTVISLRLFELNGTMNKAITVHKRRSGPHSNALREFIIEANNIAIGRPLEDLKGIISEIPWYNKRSRETDNL